MTLRLWLMFCASCALMAITALAIAGTCHLVRDVRPVREVIVLRVGDDAPPSQHHDQDECERPPDRRGFDL